MGGLAGQLAGRLGQASLVALVIGIATFAMMHALPGDAAFRIAAGRYGYDVADAAAAAAVRAELGLERPLLAQLWDWLSSLAMLDFGRSSVTGTPVVEEIRIQLVNSLVLALAAIVLSLLVAIPIGAAAGLRPGHLFDRLSLGASTLLRATPAFILGVILMLVLAVWAGIAPVAGHGTTDTLFLPAVTLALGLAAVSSRVVRNAVVEVRASDQYAFALAKGLPRRTALMRHVVRNAAIPVVAYLGVQLVFLIEGVVIIEALFAWPGIGHALVHAIFSRDIPMVQGTALALGLMFVVLNFGVDVYCRIIDPREVA
jgi:peptide/nickel transport system permease protein